MVSIVAADVVFTAQLFVFVIRSCWLAWLGADVSQWISVATATQRRLTIKTCVLKLWPGVFVCVELDRWWRTADVTRFWYNEV